MKARPTWDCPIAGCRSGWRAERIPEAQAILRAAARYHLREKHKITEPTEAQLGGTQQENERDHLR